MENKRLKRGFALFSTLMFIGVLFFYTYSISQSNIFQSNLNKLKYMNLQVTIHFDYVKKFIMTHSEEEINTLSLEDERFLLNINASHIDGTTTYYVVIEAIDGDIPIRLSEIIIK